MQRIVLLLEYDGLAFVGYQAQHNLPTIEAALRQALAALHIPVDALVVAGRTDAGVHALGQIVHLDTTSPIEARRLAPGLNFFLPPTIRVQRSELAHGQFHARLGSVAKHYRYQLWQGLHPPAIARNQVWHLRGPIDLQAMQQACQLLTGHHDFEAFRSAHCDATHARRHIYGITIEPCQTANLGQSFQVDIFGNAFCRHMCRILIGTLVAAGRQQMQLSHIQALLANRDRRQAGATAPPHGLYLMEIRYPEFMAPSWQPKVSPLQHMLAQTTSNKPFTQEFSHHEPVASAANRCQMNQ